MKNLKSIYFALPLLAVILLSGCVHTPEVIKVEPTGNVGIKQGDSVSEFTVFSLDRETFTSDELRGKTIVITSSAAWCATCKLEAKEFAPVYNEFKDKGVIFITLDIDPRDSDQLIKEFIQKTDTPWIYGNALKNRGTINTLAMNAFEITYVIDKDGLIVFKDRVITTSNTLRAAIQLALNN